jgi:microcystin-dependent protein
MEVFLGTIMAVGFNFAPRGWAMCSGQLLSISQNSALFALLGTAYGGNGQTTFGLPDLRGRTLVGMGQGPGTGDVQLGQLWGTDNATVIVNGVASVTIDAAHLPKHSHPVSIDGSLLEATSSLKVTKNVGIGMPDEGFTIGTGGTSGPGMASIYVGNNVAPTVTLNAGSVATKLSGQIDTTTGENTGGGGAIPVPITANGLTSIVQPSLGINYIIALQGIFPSRN